LFEKLKTEARLVVGPSSILEREGMVERIVICDEEMWGNLGK
jgi:hypothetical protein